MHSLQEMTKTSSVEASSFWNTKVSQQWKWWLHAAVTKQIRE